MAAPTAPTVKTRFLIMSDTHTAVPYPEEDSKHAFRHPLPAADVLLHAGDLTSNGARYQHERTVSMLKAVPAALKIVIPGNHDITLDKAYIRRQRDLRPNSTSSGGDDYDPDACRALYTDGAAQAAGIAYMEEGTQTFALSNGARFTVYASAYQPEFCGWAFAYERDEDRFNPAPPVAKVKAVNPVPDFPRIDIMVTHGPPYGVLDEVRTGMNVGCEHLLRAMKRCRPRLAAFGHIHEGWGASRMDWKGDRATDVKIDQEGVLRDRAAFMDVSMDSSNPLQHGSETLLINAAIRDVRYRVANGPFLVDVDLPVAQD